MGVKLQRYLVRRSSGDVWPWAEGIAKRADIEEVWAEDALQAKIKKALPDAREVSMGQLDEMSKADLMIFAEVRLGQPMDPTHTKAVMLDLIKAAIFSGPGPDEAANLTTRSFATAGDIRSSGAAGHGGDKATIAGTRESVADNPALRP